MSCRTKNTFSSSSLPALLLCQEECTAVIHPRLRDQPREEWDRCRYHLAAPLPIFPSLTQAYIVTFPQIYDISLAPSCGKQAGKRVINWKHLPFCIERKWKEPRDQDKKRWIFQVDKIDVHLLTEVEHEILMTATCPDASEFCITKKWQMLTSVLVLDSEENKCYVQLEVKTRTSLSGSKPWFWALQMNKSKRKTNNGKKLFSP